MSVNSQEFLDSSTCKQSLQVAELLVTHTHTTGTLIEGTTKGDGTAKVLKQHGWRWSGNLGLWYVPQTRLVSSPARAQKIATATVAGLQSAGFTVTLEADWSVPEDSLDARIAQQQNRVASLDRKLARKIMAETVADARDKVAGDALPYGGEPVKIGHHSEGRHRRALERAHTTAMKAAEAGRDTRAAEESLNTAQGRLARMEAEVGRVVLTRDDLAGAVAVKDRHGWHRVVRVNQKTVTILQVFPWLDVPVNGHVAIGKVLDFREATK